jgi:hypothetical protein
LFGAAAGWSLQQLATLGPRVIVDIVSDVAASIPDVVDTAFLEPAGAGDEPFPALAGCCCD